MSALILLFTMIAAQSQSLTASQDQLTLRILVVDEINSGSPVRLWFQITNVGGSARILCRESRGIRYTSSDPKEVMWSDSGTTIHGCGDDDHDPLWLLLPGESRFDSLELEGAITAAGSLLVNEVLVDKTQSGSPAAIQPRYPLSWSGQIVEAIASGKDIRSYRK
jgi:hypothetical protein